ncbi:MAG: rhomboid family intramembrane serine protease [Myxococcota bacterium]|nr:rhomboid family intramembrane serine protease [Myxococcota bacterium]
MAADPPVPLDPAAAAAAPSGRTADDDARERLDEDLAEAELRTPAEAMATAMPARAGLPWVTVFLAVANVAVFAWAISAGADPIQPTAQWMAAHGGNFGPITLGGEPWRMFTSMFLHYGLLHLAMNLIGLIDGGRHVERMYGRAGFIALYVVAGLGGSFASALRGHAVSAGASGAVFGVFGAFGAFLYLHRDRLDKTVVAHQSRGLLVFIAYNVVFGITAQGIDLVAHLGGLAVGFLAGLALELGSTHDHSTVRRSLLVGVLGVGLVFGGAMLAPRPSNAIQELSEAESVVLERWNKTVGEIQAGTITDTAAADVIEQELLPKWRAARLAYEGEGSGKLHDVMVRYLQAREDGWQQMAKGLRAQDEAAVKQGMARFQEADAMVEEIKAASK